MENKKIVLGLSGGVDSAVAARLLLDQGWQVYGLYLCQGQGLDAGAAAALAVARELDIPLAFRNIQKPLWDKVCQPFAQAYLSGKTPNPCALCNPLVKFPTLFDFASKVGANCVATGHYARIFQGRLYRGRPENDQSYMLARLSPNQLKRCVFPLGDYKKSEIRALASQFSLSVAHRPDSMEICFIPDNNYPKWLENHGFFGKPGDFVDKNGNILGQHKGIHHYTLGQGSGLGLSGVHKYYVSAIIPEQNQVVLSDGTDLLRTHIALSDPLWFVEIPQKTVTIRFRHSRTETHATLVPQGIDRVLVQTLEPVRAPTPGQLAVFYDGDAVVGSGWII